MEESGLAGQSLPVVQLEALLRAGDGAEDGLPVDAALDVTRRSILVREHLGYEGDLALGRHHE